MSKKSLETWELHIQEIARGLPYPPTPDLAGQISRRLGDRRTQPFRYRRNAVMAAVLMLILLAGAMLVPPVRAAVLDFLQLGAVRIFLGEPTLTPTLAPSPESFSGTAPSIPSPTRLPSAAPRDLVNLQELGGETSLENAIKSFKYTLLLPAYPPDLGAPDGVYLQDSQFLIMVWTKLDQPEEIEMSVHVIGPDSWAVTKMGPEILLETSVGGDPAFWAVGPYPLRLTNGNMEIRRLVSGNVLIWMQEGITYRLESTLELDEAIKVAESMRPYPTPKP